MRPKNEAETTLGRFRAFLRSLLSVSKKELDEAIEAEKNLVQEPKDVEPSGD